MNFLIEYLVIIGKNLLKNKFYAYTRKTTLIVKKRSLLKQQDASFLGLFKRLRQILDDCSN